MTPRGRIVYRAAETLARFLEPACARIEIAGSIRRRKPEPKDIELVAISNLMLGDTQGDEQMPMFGPMPETEKHLAVWYLLESLYRDRDASGNARVVPLKPGTSERIVDPNWTRKKVASTRYVKLHLQRSDVVVDLFLTTPEAWGAILAIRTGPADFSAAMVRRWTKLSGGGHFTDGRVVDAKGMALETPEERDVFAVCRMHWLEPFERLSEDSIMLDD